MQTLEFLANLPSVVFWTPPPLQRSPIMKLNISPLSFSARGFKERTLPFPSIGFKVPFFFFFFPFYFSFFSFFFFFLFCLFFFPLWALNHRVNPWNEVSKFGTLLVMSIKLLVSCISEQYRFSSWVTGAFEGGWLVLNNWNVSSKTKRHSCRKHSQPNVDREVKIYTIQSLVHSLAQFFCCCG